jgi:sortase A
VRIDTALFGHLFARTLLVDAMTRTRRRRLVFLASLILLGAGLYLVVCGVREAMRKEIGKIGPPVPPSPPRPPAAALHQFPLRRGETVARLTIPRLQGEWHVVEGAEEASLRLGPGHVTGTAFPGEKGNCVIAGHRDTQFRKLKDIRQGDEIVLRAGSGESRYKVTGWEIVKPTNTHVLNATPNAVLNLITCYPFYYVGHAPSRFIVHAEMVGPEVAGQ